ncbi:MAG: hypothetical protein JWP52_4132, partial [Rhizobacter sp.]|nr:hypothetical protein [Rhizobacter sp.]
MRIPETSERSLLPRWARVCLYGSLKIAIGALLVAWSLVLVAWVGLQWGILPNIEQWRGPIEQRASKALGVTVRIGHIAVEPSGWLPSVELLEVQLLDPEQRVALRLPKVAAAVSLRSLLAFDLRFEQLVIDGAELDIRRDAQSHFWVAGLDMSGPGGPDDLSGADWFFKQREFVIRSGAVRWIDELRGAPPLSLSIVSLVIRNGLLKHVVRLDATRPPEWGERFSLVGK